MEKIPNNEKEQSYLNLLTIERERVIEQINQNKNLEGREAISGDDTAEMLEDSEIGGQVNSSLLGRLSEIDKAIERIKEGKGNICAIGDNHEIEEGRRNADPASVTCIKHMDLEEQV